MTKAKMRPRGDEHDGVLVQSDSGGEIGAAGYFELIDKGDERCLRGCDLCIVIYFVRGKDEPFEHFYEPDFTFGFTSIRNEGFLLYSLHAEIWREGAKDLMREALLLEDGETLTKVLRFVQERFTEYGTQQDS